MAFSVTSSAFASGGAIPKLYTCQGTDVSPALVWSGHPTHTASFALIVHDPDARGGTWVYWMIWNIPGSAQQLAKNVTKHDNWTVARYRLKPLI